MTKIPFEDLPSTNTPLNANNLNTLQDNVEDAIDVVAGDIPTIDSSVSTSSTNPVENQAITNYVDSSVSGDLVVDSIRTKNMFDKSTFVAGDITDASTTIRISSRQVLWLETGTYTFSCNITSPFRYSINVENTGIPPLSSYPTMIYDSGWKTSSDLTTTFTLNTAGWVLINLSKENNATLTIDEIKGFNYQLEAGSTATTYSPYQNLNTEQTILFNNSTGLYTDITLNDNADNYNYLKIYAEESGGRSVYTEVYKGTSFVGKRFILGGPFVIDSSSGYIRIATFSISTNTTIITDTTNRQAQITLGTTPSVAISLANSVRIFRIIGCK